MTPKVLIVDDKEDARDMYKYALVDLGGLEPGEVIAVSSGGEALEYLERNEGIKLVLLDLAMPILDGLTTAEEIRRNERSHPGSNPVMLAFLTGSVISEVDENIADRVQVERPFLEKDGDVFKVSDQVKRWLQRA